MRLTPLPSLALKAFVLVALLGTAILGSGCGSSRSAALQDQTQPIGGASVNLTELWQKLDFKPLFLEDIDRNHPSQDLQQVRLIDGPPQTLVLVYAPTPLALDTTIQEATVAGGGIVVVETASDQIAGGQTAANALATADPYARRLLSINGIKASYVEYQNISKDGRPVRLPSSVEFDTDRVHLKVYSDKPAHDMEVVAEDLFAPRVP